MQDRRAAAVWYKVPGAIWARQNSEPCLANSYGSNPERSRPMMMNVRGWADGRARISNRNEIKRGVS